MSTLPWLHPARVALLEAALQQRILIIDGGMGTMLQAHELDEEGFRGARFSEGLDGHSQADGSAGHTETSNTGTDVLCGFCFHNISPFKRLLSGGSGGTARRDW